MGDLLTARAPGVDVVRGTQIGAGTRIRIRGTSSLSLSNNPIYIVDGMRVEGTTGSSSVSVGGTTPSRVNDLNPEEIETIEVVRGPSAATLYGTDAANGVIVITTKRGVAGRPQFTYFTEQGAHVDNNTYPDCLSRLADAGRRDTTSTASNTVQCFLSQVSAGTCKQDSVTSYNLYNDPESTPNGVGYRQLHGLQVRRRVRGAALLPARRVGERRRRPQGAGVRPALSRGARPHASAAEEASPNHHGPRHDARELQHRAVAEGRPRDERRLHLAGPAAADERRLRRRRRRRQHLRRPRIQVQPHAATGDTLYGWRQFTPRDIYQQSPDQASSA